VAGLPLGKTTLAVIAVAGANPRKYDLSATKLAGPVADFSDVQLAVGMEVLLARAKRG